MTDLSPEARRLLGLARRGDDPADADRDRVGRHMTNRLALAAGVAATTLGATKVASGAAAMSILLGKGLVTGVMVTAAAVGVWKAADHFVVRQRTTATHVARNTSDTRDTSAVRRAAVFDPAQAPRLDVAPPLAVPAASATPTASTQGESTNAAATDSVASTASAQGESTNAATATPTASARGESTNAAAAAPPVTASSLREVTRLGNRGVVATNQPQKASSSERSSDPRVGTATNLDDSDATADPLLAETAALRETQQAMTAGQPERALRLIREQNGRFASGVLHQERAAAEVFALCGLGRITEARRQAEAFERRWPRSPMIARVRRACERP